MSTTPNEASPLYPKSHLLAASGIAALLSLALLVFPSREVEAKKTNAPLETETSADQLKQQMDTPNPNNATNAPDQPDSSPFAQVEPQSVPTENATAEPAAAHNPGLKAVTVSKGDTLATLFNKVGLSTSDMHNALDSDKQSKALNQLKLGQVLEFQLTPDGKLQSVSTKVSDVETIRLAKSDQGYSFSRDLTKPSVHTTYARGVIKSSLSLSAQRAGLPHSMVMDLANIFGYDIDFAQDIREGDEFEVIYENRMVGNKSIGTGSILSARFTNRGKSYTAIRYTSKQGTSTYYTAEGNAMRKAFIRTPVDFARISSRFSLGRMHPILNKIRAHKGVDYAAPRGTPIKATGDGKVELAGVRGGYGNTVIIKHSSVYTTLYGHMQGFAKGIRTGSTVKQGQVIGYIGTTGLSTGPHLHYEFQVNGVHVDPLGQKLPMADPIAKSEKQRFLTQSQPLMARMDQEKATMLALNKHQ